MKSKVKLKKLVVMKELQKENKALHKKVEKLEAEIKTLRGILKAELLEDGKD